ncbi:MAG: PAS domain-containing protein [bacterium]|nr:PAS domain-containing protein [bacterium]
MMFLHAGGNFSRKLNLDTRIVGRGLLFAVLAGASFISWHYGNGYASGAGLIGTLSVLGTSIALAWMAEAGKWNSAALLPIQMVIDVLAVGLVGFFANQTPPVIALLVVFAVLVQGLTWGFFHQSLKMQVRDSHNHLKVQKARWEVRNIIDNIRSGLLTVDKNGVVVRVNPACCRILEMEDKDLLGRKLVDICRGGMEPLTETIMPVAEGGAAVDRGEVSLKRLGRDMPVGLNVNHIIAPSGKIMGAISIFTDLTREKKMSERVRQNDRLAAVGELAASIAHEIRNPLSSIRGSVEMLADDLELDGEHAELMALVLKESSRVNTIINDFLAYSRMRTTTRRRFPGQEFRDEISLQIRQHIAARNGNIHLSCSVQPDDMDVVADPGQLTQMALNLVINACEAMNYEGELKICLRLLAAGTRQELAVSDNGPGVAEDIREELFTPFMTDKEKGTGLGLSIVQRIAIAHGGDVQYEDSPGGGSTFRVRWPMVHVPELLHSPSAADTDSILAKEPPVDSRKTKELLSV